MTKVLLNSTYLCLWLLAVLRTTLLPYPSSLSLTRSLTDIVQWPPESDWVCIVKSTYTHRYLSPIPENGFLFLLSFSCCPRLFSLSAALVSSRLEHSVLPCHIILRRTSPSHLKPSLPFLVPSLSTCLSRRRANFSSRFPTSAWYFNLSIPLSDLYINLLY